MYQIIDSERQKKCESLVKEWLFSGGQYADLSWSIYHFVSREIMENEMKVQQEKLREEHKKKLVKEE